MLPKDKKPPAKAIIDKFAPNTAAFETPKVEGDAITFPNVVCIINPLTAKPAPAIKAARILGTLIFHIIFILVALPCLNKAIKLSLILILELPTNKQTKVIAITKAKITKIVIIFAFLVFAYSFRKFNSYLLTKSFISILKIIHNKNLFLY